MKVIWRNIHLWLGLAAGLIFFLECLSGTLLVFEDEITLITHRSRYEVSETSQPHQQLEKLIADIRLRHPNEDVASVKVYRDPHRTLEVFLTPGKKKDSSQPGSDRKGPKSKESIGRRERKGYFLFVNPYTGIETGKLNPGQPTFFSFMLKVHQTLLAGEIGKTILGISTFAVLFILVTGMILWFPKKRKQLNARLTLKTNVGWKRLNHDLHIVLGFYCTFFILIFLITSLAWSFKWANKALYLITDSKMPAFEKVNSISRATGKSTISYQYALHLAQKTFYKSDSWTIAMPDHPDGTVNITTVSKDALHNNGFDNLILDQRTGAILKTSLLKDMPGGWQLRRYMKPIHTGSIGGLSTKILASLVSLFSATFPVTGTILWLNRIKKKKKKVSSSVTALAI